MRFFQPNKRAQKPIRPVVLRKDINIYFGSCRSDRMGFCVSCPVMGEGRSPILCPELP